MRLKKIHVTNFRSVADCEEFEVDDVTCLVGKNEAGKSAILLALAALNPNEATPVTLHRERDYPRRNLIRYRQMHGDEEAVAIRTTWELEDSEMRSIARDIGEGVLLSPVVEVSRRYGSDMEVDPQIDFPVAVKHYYSLFALDASERAVLRSPKSIEELIEAIDNVAPPTDKHKQLREHVSRQDDLRTRVVEHVTRALPTFMYVSSYDRMDGAIQIENTCERLESGELELDEHRGSRLFVDFLENAGVSIDDISDVATYETFNAMLQAASTNITDQVLEYWSQNPDLDVEVRIDKARPGDPPPFDEGTIARARIKNNLHRVDTPFSERSAGFVWFFSFLVKFAQVRNAGGPVILLLDEPGLSLHGKAQSDLLRFMDDKLAPNHQVIYSTHSPFMVPADQLQRVRIVEDRIEVIGSRRTSQGTKVCQDVLAVEKDTLFPLQGALGYKVTQDLFVGDHTLLVDGPGDLLFLQSLSSALRVRGRPSLDSRWTICPAGGLDRIMPFVALFAGNRLHVAVLSNSARGVKGRVQKIRRSDILQAGHFFTVADFIKRREGDVEDIFDPELYADVVNRCYDLPEAHRITKKKLGQDPSTTRLVKKVENLFSELPEPIPAFNRYAPANWLARNSDVLTSSDARAIKRTLSTAEKIFETFNNLLR